MGRRAGAEGTGGGGVRAAWTGWIDGGSRGASCRMRTAAMGAGGMRRGGIPGERHWRRGWGRRGRAGSTTGAGARAAG
jgi:hypothetical protein